MPIPTRVSIRPDENSNHHIIDIVASDRPGLLSRLASMLLKHRVRLHNAKINTLGNRAEDTFVVSGQAGNRLQTEDLQLLQEDLLKKYEPVIRQWLAPKQNASICWRFV